MLTSSDLTKFLQEMNIGAEIVCLEADTRTVAEAALVLGVAPDQIIKSILFLADGEPILVINNGLARVDWKQLADYLGVSRRRLKSANAEMVLDITGYPVGAVPPFGHKIKLRTVVSTAVYQQTLVYGGGGEVQALLKLTTAELQRVVGRETAVIKDEG